MEELNATFSAYPFAREQLKIVENIHRTPPETYLKYGNLIPLQISQIHQLETEFSKEQTDEMVHALYELYALDESMDDYKSEPEGRFAYTHENSIQERTAKMFTQLEILKQLGKLRRRFALQNKIHTIEQRVSELQQAVKPQSPEYIQEELKEMAQSEIIKTLMETYFPDHETVTPVLTLRHQQRYLSMNPLSEVHARYPLLHGSANIPDILENKQEEPLESECMEITVGELVALYSSRQTFTPQRSVQFPFSNTLSRKEMVTVAKWLQKQKWVSYQVEEGTLHYDMGRAEEEEKEE